MFNFGNLLQNIINGAGKFIGSLTQQPNYQQPQQSGLNLMQVNQPAPITPQPVVQQMPVQQPIQAFKQYQPAPAPNIPNDLMNAQVLPNFKLPFDNSQYAAQRAQKTNPQPSVGENLQNFFQNTDPLLNIVGNPQISAAIPTLKQFVKGGAINTLLGGGLGLAAHETPQQLVSQIPQNFLFGGNLAGKPFEENIQPMVEEQGAKVKAFSKPGLQTALGEAGNVKLGPGEEPFQGIRTTSTAEDLANMVPGKSQAKFINGEKLAPTQKIEAETAPAVEAASPLPTPPQVSKTPQFKQAFADWVNGKAAIPIEKKIVSNQFNNLKDQGIEAFHKIQQGDVSTPEFQAVRSYLDKKFADAQAGGYNFGYQPDYLPQMWNNTPEEISKVFGSSIMNRPGFTTEKLIEDYKTGIDAGLTPRFNNVPDLLAHYEGQVNKAVADRGFVNFLGQNGLISPTQGAPKGWKMLDPEHFPRMKVNVGQSGMEHYSEGPFSAPAQVADMINNHLTNPKSGSTFEQGLAKVADFNTSVKNKALSFGVPKTALNIHGFNEAFRHTAFGTGGNVITRAFKSAKYLVNANAAGKYFEDNLQGAADATKAGLKLGTEDHTALGSDATFRTKFGEAWNNTFEKPLFNKMIPAIKLETYQNLVKKGMNPNDAAAMTNNVYGGINWEAMGRDKNIQNFLRAVVLAPDWAESNIRLGSNLVKSFTKGGDVAARYRTMAGTLVGAYVAANAANKLSSGHYMWENDPGHTFEIEAGYTKDGTKRYFAPFGTAADFIKVPYDIALGLSKGDPSVAFTRIRNRLSVPLGAAVSLATNTDYRGKPIYGKDQYGNKMTPLQSAEGIGTQVAQGLGLPAFLKQAADTATGKQGVEQGLMQGLELPFRYTASPTSKSVATVKGVAQGEGQTGKQLYDTIHSAQGQTFSKNQQELIRQGGTSVIQPILDTKKANQQLKQMKDAATGKTSSADSSTVQAADNQTVSAPRIQAPDATQLALARAKVKLGQPLTTQEQQALTDSQQPQIQSSQYELNIQRAKDAKDPEAFVKTTQAYIDYLGAYEKSLNPQTDQAKINNTQKKIEDLTAQKDKVSARGGVGGGKGRKVSTSRLLSAFKYKTTTPKTFSRKSIASPKIPVFRSKIAAFKPAVPRKTVLTKHQAL